MTEPVHCWFKRNIDSNNNPTGDWEEGSVFSFAPYGDVGQAALVSAKDDGLTLIIPAPRLMLTTEHPDVVTKRFADLQAAKAKKIKDEDDAKAREEYQARKRAEAIAKAAMEAEEAADPRKTAPVAK